MSRAKSGSGVLVGVLVLGVLGFVTACQAGPPTPARESIQSAPRGESGDAAEPVPDGPPETLGGGIPARPSEAVSMTVEHVHDGDTLFLRTDHPNALVATTDAVKVRLLGIDTPEVGDHAECFGDQATEQLRALLPDGSRTWITVDQDPYDRYGRSLFYLWTEDGRFVNYELVASGAAESLMIAPNDAYYPLLRTAEAAATTSGAGMWGACDDNAPPARETAAPDPIPDSAPVSWDCVYDPTMNNNWHDDVYCTNGVQSERPNLLPGQFVTEADMRAAAEEYEAELNQ